jgi:hypothetical protein
MEWKWSLPTTEKGQRSYRKKEFAENNSVPDKRIEQDAIQQSLLSPEEAWVREETWKKITTASVKKREHGFQQSAEREKMIQIGYNPFLTQNNYVEDLRIQDIFLKPSMQEPRKKELGE